MVTLEGHRSLLEEALARLLDAEVKLEETAQPSLEDDVDVVKQMYYGHEVKSNGGHRSSLKDILFQGSSYFYNTHVRGVPVSNFTGIHARDGQSARQHGGRPSTG